MALCSLNTATEAPPSMAGVESWSDTEEESAHKAKQAQANPSKTQKQCYSEMCGADGLLRNALAA
eukprot:5950850-Amphidinium_carterae.2